MLNRINLLPSKVDLPDMLLWQPIQQLFQSSKKLGSHQQFNPAKTLIHKWRTDLPLKRQRKSHIPGLKHLLITKNIMIDWLRRHSFLFLLSSLSGEAVVPNTRGNMRPVTKSSPAWKTFVYCLHNLCLLITISSLMMWSCLRSLLCAPVFANRIYFLIVCSIFGLFHLYLGYSLEGNLPGSFVVYLLLSSKDTKYSLNDSSSTSCLLTPLSKI